MTLFSKKYSRREAIRTGLAAGAGLALSRFTIRQAAAQAQLPLITRPIPSTGEMIPVVGIGTNRYGVQTPEEMAPLRDVLRRLPELGGTVVDTAHNYGRSEEVIGELVAGIGNRDRLFISTKASTRQNDVAEAVGQMEESLSRLQTGRLDLLSVHNLSGTDVMLPVMREWKQDGRIRYIGITTSSDGAHDDMIEIMRREPLDFVQVNYSIGNRSVAEDVLPLALDRGIAVMLNVPFGGRRSAGELFEKAAGHPLPAWAAEFDCTSWAQFFLKYLVSHPAVTVAIPGTRSIEHLVDNHGAARGRLPDAATRRRMEQFWDSM